MTQNKKKAWEGKLWKDYFKEEIQKACIGKTEKEKEEIKFEAGMALLGQNFSGIQGFSIRGKTK